MEFVETTLFTRQVRAAMTDDEYAGMQEWLVARPDAGTLMPGGGGLRKLRWAGSGRGKRGGCRVIYYWASTCDVIVLFYLYRKNETEDLTREQLAALRKLVKDA